MQETNDKIEELKKLIEIRAELLSILRAKEDIKNLTQNDDENLVNDFDKTLTECENYDTKIKKLKKEVSPKEYLKLDEEENKYTGNVSAGTALVVKKENKIISWFKNKINEYRFNYLVERALKRDEFLEENITNQIDSYTAFLNVIKSKGNKAIFIKTINKLEKVNEEITLKENVEDIATIKE